MYHITENNFKKVVLESNVPVIIEVTADWCGTTHITKPILNRIISKYKNKIRYCTLDFEKYGKIAEGLGIHSIPVLLIYNNAILESTITGTYAIDVLEYEISLLLTT